MNHHTRLLLHWPRRRIAVFAIVGITLQLLTLGRIQAQATVGTDGDAPPVDDSIRDVHTVHITPHLLVLTPHTTTATLTFSNPGDRPAQADVEIQYGFTDWPDTNLVAPVNTYYPNARDTVLRTPGPTEHFLGRWISGVPTHLLLKPHETRHMTLRVAPPDNLPAGEYYARIVTIVQPKLPGRGSEQDTKAIYELSVKAPASRIPTLRDSTRVFYRQGALKLRVAIDHPTTGIGKAPADATLQLQDDWIRVPIHLTGNMHFEGEFKHYVRNDATGEIASALTTLSIALQHSGVIHHWCDVPARQPLPKGHYTLFLRLEATQEEFPAAERIPMKPVQDSIPFDIK